MFAQQVEQEDMRAVFLEYAWDMGWCDPCAADPLSRDELRELGVFWLGDGGDGRPDAGRRAAGPGRVRHPAPRALRRRALPRGPGLPGDRRPQNFQGRYVLRHPWTGDDRCDEARDYRRELPRRREREAQTLASLTGWDDRRHPRQDEPEGEHHSEEGDEPWWKSIWKDSRPMRRAGTSTGSSPLTGGPSITAPCGV